MEYNQCAKYQVMVNAIQCYQWYNGSYSIANGIVFYYTILAMYSKAYNVCIIIRYYYSVQYYTKIMYSM